MEQVSSNIDEKYTAYFAGLTELIQFLESGNMDAYFAQPTQGMQNALGAALGEYAKVSGDLYHSAFTESQNDYRFAKWQMAAMALALVGWLGIRDTRDALRDFQSHVLPDVSRSLELSQRIAAIAAALARATGMKRSRCATA